MNLARGHPEGRACFDGHGTVQEAVARLAGDLVAQDLLRLTSARPP